MARCLSRMPGVEPKHHKWPCACCGSLGRTTFYGVLGECSGSQGSGQPPQVSCCFVKGLPGTGCRLAGAGGRREEGPGAPPGCGNAPARPSGSEIPRFRCQSRGDTCLQPFSEPTDLSVRTLNIIRHLSPFRREGPLTYCCSYVL